MKNTYFLKSGDSFQPSVSAAETKEYLPIPDELATVGPRFFG
jgi:hypothetical protein